MSEARIICLCIYYDEHPEWLSQHLASLAPVCSEFVYVDGAYALFPGAFAQPNSRPEVAIALHEMARACNRSILHYRPARPYEGNEVQKRNLSLDLARTLPDVAGDRDSWFLIADADTVAIKVNDALPSVLTETQLDVAEFGVEQEEAYDPPPASAGRWAGVHQVELAKPLRIRGIYRNLPGLRYGPAHWHVTCDGEDGTRRWLWGGSLRKQEPSFDATLDLRFEHRRARRAPGRNQAAARYYEIRDTAQVEHG